MEKALILTFAITLLYGIFKFIEMKYVEDEMKPLKELVRDLAIVFVSSFICSFGYLHYQTKLSDFFDVLTNSNTLQPDNIQVFTGNPDF